MADRRLQVFHAVIKYGSFTRAAARLFMTQPAVTFQIKQLEEQFNTRLLERGRGSATPTPAGDIVANYAERILGLNDEMEARVAELTDELSGTLNIGTSTTIATYWLPYILEGFKRAYPCVVPRVSVGNSTRIVDQVATRDLDLGLIELVTDHPSLERRAAARDELEVICSPDHPLANSKALSAADLLPHAFITREPGNGIRELSDEYFVDAGISLDDLIIAAELGSLAAVKQMAAQGFGFAIASHTSSLRDVREGGVVAIPLSPQLFTPLEVIFPKDKFRSRLITTFAEFAESVLVTRSQR